FSVFRASRASNALAVWRADINPPDAGFFTPSDWHVFSFPTCSVSRVRLLRGLHRLAIAEGQTRHTLEPGSRKPISYRRSNTVRYDSPSRVAACCSVSAVSSMDPPMLCRGVQDPAHGTKRKPRGCLGRCAAHAAFPVGLGWYWS